MNSNSISSTFLGGVVSHVFNSFTVFFLRAEGGGASAVQRQSTRGAETAAAGSGLLRLHSTSKRTSSLVLGLLPAG